MTAKQLMIMLAVSVLALVGYIGYIAAQSAVVVGAFQVALVTVAASAALAAVGGLAFAGTWAYYRFRHWAVGLRTADGQSVQFFAAEGQVYAVNPGGRHRIHALHLDTRSIIDEQPDDVDQIDALKWAAFNTRRQKVLNGLIEPPMQLEAGLAPVMPVIIDGQRILVNGGMGSGKTNLLQHLAAEKARLSKVLVIDTHASPGLWPIDPEAVLGRGRNWAAVESALESLLGVMDRRYKDIDAGTVPYRGHETITVIADEWTMIPQIIGQDAIKSYTMPVLVESRKAGIDFVLATHDTTVDALGIKGMAGLKRAFDWIVETQKRPDGQYVCLVRKPSQKPSEAVEYAAPPLFANPAALPPAAIEPEWVTMLKNEPVTYEPDEGELADDGPTKEEESIMVAYYQVRDENGGKVVLKQVCEKLGWNPGGMQYSKIKAAMKKWTDEDL